MWKCESHVCKAKVCKERRNFVALAKELFSSILHKRQRNVYSSIQKGFLGHLCYIEWQAFSCSIENAKCWISTKRSKEYIANGIGQCINLRKLDISFLKCLRDVSFTKDMLHLKELCMDQCQNISLNSALQGLQGHPNLDKLSMNLCFQFKSCQLQQLCVSAKRLKYFSAERCSQISAATGRKMLEESSNLTFFAVTPLASLNSFTEWNSNLRNFHDISFGNDLLFLHRVTHQFL